ncbi:hypothetical protein REPUB_Repub16aG0148600 [Reevesia pubescens]
MGFISRKIFPACESMCVCCPALRSRSRQPVKRYKKLLSEIFPKSPDAPPNERKIAKLCEYAAKNPVRIPKIAKYLEERCYKELRHEHIKFINIVTEAYNKLLCMCKEQMAYFAVNLLNVVSELLENSKQDAMRILGCQTLTSFIYSQADGTYTHSIENFVHKVCKLAREDGEEHQRRCLRASSLQCLSAMVWFMAQYSHIFAALGEMVHATLDNYELDTHSEDDHERGELHHNWVDEVVRCENRGAIVACDASPRNMIIRPQPEKKDPSLLTREEVETPKVWAKICIQRMVELAKESTTLRQVLDPMFVYLDSRQHWVPQQGLAMVVLSDMSYWEVLGNQQLILAAVVHHLDHKNVAHDPQLKSYIIQVAAALARQIRSRGVLAEIGFVSDLCRHLRKSFQATLESVGEQEANVNILLQNSIEDCLLEITKGIDDARPLFDMMAISLEKLPSSGVVARATIGSLMVLAHMISLALVSSHSQLVFPESLLVQLLKAMLHPNVEVRVGAHQIFSALLIPISNRPRREVASLRSGFVYETRRWRSNNASAFASISALLEKLRREKEGIKMEMNGYNIHDGCKGMVNVEEERKQGHVLKSSHNIYNFTSIIDRTAAPNMVEAEPYILKLTEDQIMQLLSAFWIQATLPDNLPSNIEAISHSFVLTLISLRLKNINDNLVVRFFQFPLSLKNISLDPSNGMLTPALQRSMLMLSMGMLMFAAKIYQIPDLNDLIESIVLFDADPYLGISEDLQVFVRPQADVRVYGSVTDNQLASSLLLELRDKIYESNNIMMDILVQNLSTITELEIDDLSKQLFEPFTPDDAFMFDPLSILNPDHNQMISHSKESLSFDEDVQTSSLLEDDARSEASVLDLSRFIPKVPASPMVSHVISIGQLLESSLEVAGQVAATSVSTSPLPYDTMASRCEAFGTGTRKKLSNWLVHENYQNGAAEKVLPTVPADMHMMLRKITNESAFNRAVSRLDPCLSMRLPPASPFDNFLKAARC